MENQINTGELNTPQDSQNPTSQPVATPEKPETNYLLIGGVALVCSLIFGFGGYYLGKQSSNSQYVNSAVQTNPTATPYPNNPTNTPTSQTITLPTGWSYKNNGECGVKFAIPPKADPYYKPYDPNRQPSVTEDSGSGRFWDFPRGGTYPNLLAKFPNGYDQHKQAMTIFATSDEASGYISQAVAVSCIPNNGRFANNSALISSLTTELDKYNSSTGEKGMEPSTYKIKGNTAITRWGKSVADLIVTEGTSDVAYTMFITPQYTYEIKVFGATSDTFVKDTAKKIFDNLSFQ